jgi:prepilin-type N-terminal cleavage/methylation domain-containing protein
MSQGNTKGFTLIELMLAMTYISILLIAIAMTSIQISNIYNKGITLREVNQAGRAISDELQRNISLTVPFDVTPKDGSPATQLSKYVKRNGGGRLCIGRYTYAWNYGNAIAGMNGAPPVFNTYNDTAGTPVRFAKVSDPSASLCDNPSQRIARLDASEMLASGDRELVLHSFNIVSGTNDAITGQTIYAISMVIGTNDDQLLTTNNMSCKPPSDVDAGESYCSVNQFDIIVRAGNKSGGDQ